MVRGLGQRFYIDAVDKEEDYILTDKAKQEYKEARDHREAVAQAKIELKREQEIEEAESLKNTLQIVQPIKGYMTNDS